MPSQASYDEAVALAKLVLGRIKPALLLSASRSTSEDVVLLAAEPPALSAGLTTPLPASLTGEARSFRESTVIDRGVEALSVLSSKVGPKGWALGAAWVCIRESGSDVTVIHHLSMPLLQRTSTPSTRCLTALP